MIRDDGGLMARINFDDNVEAQEEFWKLLALTDGDRDAALGKLVRFFRIAQRAYGKSEPIPIETLQEHGLELMIKSGWAIPMDAGFRCKGEDKHFAWYVQKVEAASAGGRARSAGSRDERGRLLPKSSRALAEIQPGTSRGQPDSSPLAPAPALVKKEEEREFENKKTPTLSKEILESCCKTWIETLAHFKIQRPLNPSEQEQIGRAIQRWGAEFVDLSLYGARYEPSHEGFHPKDHVSLGRIFEKDKFGKHRIDKFVNWASQRKSKQQTMTGLTAQVEPDEPPADPEKVRAILAAAGFGRK